MNQTQEVLTFHALLEKEAIDLSYGQINVYVMIKDGKPVMSTLNISTQKRVKFNIEKNQR